MHSRGILHADLKPLNFVRVDGQWSIIDLDAAAVIGGDTVGLKSSSAYMPPEAIYADIARGISVVRCEAARQRTGVNFDLVLAHESFDVWSLGCIFYQLCTGTSLFKEVQDDNLSDDLKDADSLYVLEEWTDSVKDQKMSKIENPLARNLASLMLMKDPSARATLPRVLSHPFVTGVGCARLYGEKPDFDVFISYRVNSDAHHAQMLYDLLIARGLTVWWDKVCL
jgi:serine/threonine protein kinase